MLSTGDSLVEALAILLLAASLLAVAALCEGTAVSERHCSLAEHIVDSLGPGVAEGRRVVAAVTVATLAEGAYMGGGVPLAKHSQ